MCNDYCPYGKTDLLCCECDECKEYDCVGEECVYYYADQSEMA